jgi:hypothetical protein
VVESLGCSAVLFLVKTNPTILTISEAVFNGKNMGINLKFEIRNLQLGFNF